MSCWLVWEGGLIAASVVFFVDYVDLFLFRKAKLYIEQCYTMRKEES